MLPRWRMLPWLSAAVILVSFVPVYALAADHPAMIPATRWYILAVVVLAGLTLHFLLSRADARNRTVLEQRPTPDEATQRTKTQRREGAKIPLVLFASWRLGVNLFSGEHVSIALAALVVSYIAATVVLATYRWRILTLGNVDSAIVMQSLRYTLDEGRLFFNTLEKVSHLAVHSSPIYFLLLPLYALCRSPQAFLALLPPICIGISAIPFFAIARPRLGPAAAFCLTAAYLLYPSIMARSVGDLYEMTLFPCLWLPAFYYYDRRRLGPFLLFVLLSLAVKESIAATVLLFALYGLIQRRGLVWIASPALLSALSLILSFAVIMPGFGAASVSSRMAAFLGPFGASPQGLLRYALGQPLAFLRAVLSLPKLGLVYQLFQPFLFIPPFLSNEILFALPALGLNLLAQGGSIGIRAWESAIFGPLLFVATIFGVQRLAARWREWGVADDSAHETRQTATLALAVTVFFATLACAPYWFRLDDYRPRPYLAVQEAAVALIPSEASVSAPDYMMARFAERPYLQLQTGPPFWAEYHIVDVHWIASVRGHRLPERAAQEYIALVARAEQGQIYEGLRLVWGGDGIYVFKRTEG